MPEITQKMKVCPKRGRKKALAFLAGVACCFLVWTGCMPQNPETQPPATYPGVVVTRDGLSFYVKGLRIPGTRQELRLKEGDSLIWVPLEQLAVVRFTGPIRDTYRSAIIYLSGGDKLQGDVFVDFLIEGSTDMGYWNISLRKVESLQLGID